MKKLTSILIIAMALFLGACEGPAGPPGLDGLDGALTGKSFEISGNFTPGNNYTLYTEFPNNIEVYDDDAVLAYILWETVDGLKVWRLMPQSVFIRNNDLNGEIIYNYDYTYADIQVFLEFTIPEDELLPSETDNQRFKIVVLPSAYIAKHDVSNFNSLLESPELVLKSFDPVNVTINSIQK